MRPRGAAFGALVSFGFGTRGPLILVRVLGSAHSDFPTISQRDSMMGCVSQWMERLLREDGRQGEHNNEPISRES